VPLGVAERAQHLRRARLPGPIREKNPTCPSGDEADRATRTTFNKTLAFVLSTWGKDIAQFMPSEAGGSFVRTIREPNTLTPWTGLGVLAGWAVVGVIVAMVELRRCDA
jgi:hypothetical protein